MLALQNVHEEHYGRSLLNLFKNVGFDILTITYGKCITLIITQLYFTQLTMHVEFICYLELRGVHNRSNIVITVILIITGICHHTNYR